MSGRAGAGARACSATTRPPAQTVFVGGGTPTLLPPDELGRILDAIREHVGLAPGAEVTTEANPESVDPVALAALREAGFTRISLGMQSAAPHVLETLDRHHTPGRAVAAAREARAAGFEHVSLDLIFGTPGERAEDWRLSLEAALEAEPDHVSAYSLIVEPGTKLAARVRRGELPAPDDDVLADRYETAERAARRRRPALVRGRQLGPDRRRPLPPQHGLLGRRRLVGRRPGRALPRRRRALVERPAPLALDGACWPRARSPAAGREAARRRRRAAGARDARGAAARGPGARTAARRARRRGQLAADGLLDPDALAPTAARC